jgi:hypothetical protein
MSLRPPTIPVCRSRGPGHAIPTHSNSAPARGGSRAKYAFGPLYRKFKSFFRYRGTLDASDILASLGHGANGNLGAADVGRSDDLLATQHPPPCFLKLQGAQELVFSARSEVPRIHGLSLFHHLLAFRIEVIYLAITV